MEGPLNVLTSRREDGETWVLIYRDGDEAAAISAVIRWVAKTPLHVGAAAELTSSIERNKP